MVVVVDDAGLFVSASVAAVVSGTETVGFCVVFWVVVVGFGTLVTVAVGFGLGRGLFVVF